MINTTKTLKAIHEKFPQLTLDELLTILDCIVEEYDTTIPYQFPSYPNPITQPPFWYSTVTC